MPLMASVVQAAEIVVSRVKVIILLKKKKKQSSVGAAAGSGC